MSSDSEEVIIFCDLFSRIQTCCQDNPEKLIQISQLDNKLKETCLQLAKIAKVIRSKERSIPQSFAAPVNPNFIINWRDFDRRYAYLSIFDEFSFSLECQGDDDQEISSKKIQERFSNQYENAEFDAKMASYTINEAIKFSHEQLDDIDEDYRDDEGSNFRDVIIRGINYWEELNNCIGLDLEGVFRRRGLVPFVLFPRHIANQIEGLDKALVYRLLYEAQNAFVFGSSFASLALMRSIIELILRDFYKVTGTKLDELIQNARNALPTEANKTILTRLRLEANAILHSDHDELKRKMNRDHIGLEKEIVRLLHAVRSLIESAPSK